ncbi:sigma-70 family RNA polymerase sigma factor [Rhodocaloribacter sp.]
MQPQLEVTQLLEDWRAGDPEAVDQLMPLVYNELRRLAHYQLQRDRSDHTLDTTALVHEAYLNLVGQQAKWQSRAHFFAIASRVMRRILIWYARKRSAAKRGGNHPNLSLDENEVVVLPEDRLEELLSLDQALTRLKAMDARLCRIVEYRYFGGLTVDETAQVMKLSPATIKRDWKTAKAWLHRELSETCRP